MDAGARARLGSYELLHRLAIGGMGEVFLARHRGLAGVARLVAVKRMLPEHADQPGAVELFLDEAKVAASLAHPNIVQVHELGNERGTYYLAMELVAGHSLDRITSRGVAKHAPLARSLAVHAVAEALRGLAHAHAARDTHGAPLAIVHRDVSPHNVLVSYEGDVKLLDFGIARAANQTHRTRTGVVRGKPVYMSPEQLAGEPVDARADVYAAGVMLWELTLGRHLFEGEPELAIAKLVADGCIPAPRSIDPDYPPALEALVLSAIRPRREERLADAATLGDGLRAYLAASAAGDLRQTLGRVVHELFADEARALEAAIRESAAAPTARVDAAAPTARVDALADDARTHRPAPADDASTRIAPADATRSRDRARRVRPAIAILAGGALAGLAIAVAATRDAPAPARGTDGAVHDAGTHATVPTDAAPVDDPAPGAGAPTPRAEESLPTTSAGARPALADAGIPAPDAARAAASPPARPAAPPGGPPTDFATRLLPGALARIGARFVEYCGGRGVVLPRSVTFELRVDKYGRILDAELVGRGRVENPTTRCLRTWMVRHTFQLAERDASGTLTIPLPPTS